MHLALSQPQGGPGIELAALGAQLVPGFDVVADEINLDERVENCDVVITGEGLLDSQSFAGKVVGGMHGLAESKGKKFGVVVGDVDPDVYSDINIDFSVANLVSLYGEDEAKQRTLRAIENATLALLREM
jgi:glycerate kinase